MSDSRSSRKSLVLPLVVAAVAAVALLVALLGMPGDDEDDKPEQAQQAAPSDSPLAQLARRQPDDALAQGEVDAPVVMIAYSEFQCPFCGKFARDTAPTLMEKYVEDGTLRIEWRDFPYLGPESKTAALAARAAAEQGRFWEFHDEMFAEQLPPNSGNLDQEYVESVAAEVGLDLERFRVDLRSPRIEELVAADFREGQSVGVTGTPSFLINGTPIVGAQPTKVFEQVIDAAAAS